MYENSTVQRNRWRMYACSSFSIIIRVNAMQLLAPPAAAAASDTLAGHVKLEFNRFN